MKFIDDLLDGQSFLNNVRKMCKRKSLSTVEFISTTDDRSTFMINTKSDDLKFVCENCGLTLANKNDLETHLENHHGN